MNRLYTLEGNKNNTVGSWLSVALKAPKISLPKFELPKIELPRFNPPAPPAPPAPPRITAPSIQPISNPISQSIISPPKILPPVIPAVKIPGVKLSSANITRPIQTNLINPVQSNIIKPVANIGKISPGKYLSSKMPKNPFSNKPRKDQSSSYDDFNNEIEDQQNNNYAPEPNFPPVETQSMQSQQNFTQSDMAQETNQTPVYGYDYNDLMGAFKPRKNIKKISRLRPTKKPINIINSALTMGAVKLPKIKTPKIGTKFNLGRKKPSLIQKLALKPGKTKIVKITPSEAKKALAVTGAVAGSILSLGTASPGLIGGAAAIVGTTAGAITAGAGAVATASALGSTLLANGNPGIGQLLNTAGSILSNPAIQQNVPLAQSANNAINTGLDYYNTGAGIAESLGISAPSLGTTAEEMFSLLSNQETNKTDRAINAPESGASNNLNPYSNMLNNPNSPYYLPPPKDEETKGQKIISTSEKNKKPDSNNLALIIGIGFLGYLFVNKRGKK